MKKKILSMVLSLSLACTALTACGSSDSSSNADANTSTATDSEAGGDSLLDLYPVSDKELTAEDIPTENMMKRSVLNVGDQSRIAEKIAEGKAIQADETSEEIQTVAFIGGSITQGSSATGDNQYVNAVGNWWKDNVTRRTKVLNAGIGATDSYIGVHRVDRDVLAENPDVIFIEFSVNDTNAAVNEMSYDSLIRKCMSAENNPAVILVIMTQEDGTSLEEVHAKLGEKYNLPIISYRDAIYPEVEAGKLNWDLVSQDNIHPDDNGHPILTKFITSYLQSVIDDLDNLNTGSTAFTAESDTGDIYANATIGSRETTDLVTVTDEGSFTEETSFQKFTGGWGTTTGGSITFEMEFRNLGAIYYMSTSGAMGKADITIDGESAALLDGDFSGGWGDYANSQQIYTSDATAKHTVTVTVLDGDIQGFRILDWLIS